MSDSQILKELFKDVVIQTLDERAEGTHKVYSVTLNENKGGYCITIDKMSNHDEVIIINPEVFKAPLAVFNGSKGECKRADFVIIDTKEKVIIYIELKKTKGSRKGIIQQLTGAECFVSYCKKVGKSFWKNAKFLESYQHRFVSIDHIANESNNNKNRPEIHTSSIPLRSNAHIGVIHDCPDKMKAIRLPTGKARLDFNQLL